MASTQCPAVRIIEGRTIVPVHRAVRKSVAFLYVEMVITMYLYSSPNPSGAPIVRRDISMSSSISHEISISCYRAR